MNYRILHIEDDMMMQKIYKTRLEADGCSVRDIATGKKGIDATENEQFNFVLVDHVLPDMTGIDVLRTLSEKGRLKNTIAVMLSASGQEKDAEQALASGAAAFVLKDKISPRDMLPYLLQLAKAHGMTFAEVAQHLNSESTPPATNASVNLDRSNSC